MFIQSMKFRLLSISIKIIWKGQLDFGFLALKLCTLNYLCYLDLWWRNVFPGNLDTNWSNCTFMSKYLLQMYNFKPISILSAIILPIQPIALYQWNATAPKETGKEAWTADWLKLAHLNCKSCKVLCCCSLLTNE